MGYFDKFRQARQTGTYQPQANVRAQAEEMFRNSDYYREKQRQLEEWTSYIQERDALRKEQQRQQELTRVREQLPDPGALAGSYKSGLTSYKQALDARAATKKQNAVYSNYLTADMDLQKAKEEQRRASFTAGPVSPEYWARVDNAKANTAAAQKRYDAARLSYGAATKDRPTFNNWAGRDALVKEYRDLQRVLGMANDPTGFMSPAADLTPAQVRQYEARMASVRQQLEEGDQKAGNGAADYSRMDRWDSVLAGTAKSIASSIGKTGAVTWDLLQKTGAEIGSETGMGINLEKEKAAREQRIAAYNSQESAEKRKTMYDAVGRLGESAAADLERAKTGLGFLGKAGVDVASNILEMGFDAGVAALTGGSSLAVMFTRVYGDEAYRALSEGATLDQAVLFGAAKGGIEVFTEKLADGVAGIYGKGAADDITEALIRRLSQSSTGQNMLRALIGAANEGGEEVLSDLLSPLAERIYRDKSVRELYGELDPSEVLYDYLIGAAVGGFGGAAGRVTGQYAALNAENARLSAIYEMNGASPTFRQEVKDRGIEARKAEGVYNPENIAENQQKSKSFQAEAARAQELDRMQDTAMLTATFSDSGITLTEQEQEELGAIANEGNGRPSAQIIGMREAYKMGESGAELAEVEQALSDRGLTSNQIRKAWGFGASAQTALGGTADTSTEEGRTKVETAVSPLGRHADEAVKLYQSTQDVARYGAAMSKAAFLYAAQGADVEQIARDAREGKTADIVGSLTTEQVQLAQRIGEEHRQAARDAAKDLSADMAKAQEQAAKLEQGQTVRAQTLTAVETAIDTTRKAGQRLMDEYNAQFNALEAMIKADPKAEKTAAYQQTVERLTKLREQAKKAQQQIRTLEAKKNALQGVKPIQRKKGTISYAGGTVEGKTYKGVDPAKLTRQQKKVVAMVESLADAVNLDYVLIDADAGMGGAYAFGGKVFLNINAGMGVNGFSQTMAAASLSHELTHFLQEYAPEQYQELKEFITSEILKADPQKLGRLVEQQRRWERGRHLSYDQALDEVVANACQTMLLDSKAINKLARQNMSLTMQIADFIDDWSQKIRDAFSEVDTSDGAIYDSLRAVEGSLDHIQKLWDNGIEQAVRNYNAEQVTGEKVTRAAVAESATTENAAQNGDVKNQFIGESAESADRDALARARELDKQGVDNETIRQQTGWFKGMDGKWRYEIDDSGAKYSRRGDLNFRKENPGYNRFRELMEKADAFLLGDSKEWLTEAEQTELTSLQSEWGDYFREDGKPKANSMPRMRLSDYLQHDELFKNYPRLANMILKWEKLPDGRRGEFSPYSNTITLNDTAEMRHAPLDTLAHEIQHAIQKIEDFTPGADISYWLRNGEKVREKQAAKKIEGLKAQVQSLEKKLPDVMSQWTEEHDKISDEIDRIEDEIWRIENNKSFDARDYYWNTAGEIEARDVTTRRQYDSDKRKATTPNLGDENTVFADNGVQFQMLGDVEETPRLVAVHNVTEEKLLPALKLGGLPVPSIAIVKAKSGHSNYGPISLVFGKDSIDPQADRRNKVYGADAWTPMRADVEYQVNDDAAIKAESMLDRLAKKVAGGIFSSTSVLRQYGIEGATALDYDSMLQKIASSDTARAAYAAAHDIDVQPVYRQREFSSYGNEALQSYIDRVGEDTVRRLEEQLENGEWNLKPEDMQALQDALREHFLSKFAKPSVAERRAANIANNDRYVKFINAAYAYMNSNGETTNEVDRLATGNKLAEAVRSKDVVEWLRPQLTGIIGEAGIRNRTDAYTADGRRRSFWQTHDTYTLANIVKAMTSGNARGAGIHLGATHLQSITATDYSNVESMKKDASRLRRTTEEEYSAEVSAVDDQLQKLVNDIAAFNKDDSYMGKDTIGEVLIEAARGKQTVAGIQQSFKRLSEYTLSKELAEQVLSAYQAAANLPTEYFEAKPQRAVGFDEVLSAIIPDNASSTLKAALQRAGVHVDEYKAGDEADRLRKLNSVEGAQFQRWDNTGDDTAAERNGREIAYSQIEAENAVLKDTVAALQKLSGKQGNTIAKLQKRLQLTKTPEVRESDARRLARSILKEYGSTAELVGITEQLKSLGDYMLNTEASELREEEIKNRARVIAAEVVESASEQISMEDEDLSRVRSSIRGKKLTIDPAFFGELDDGFDSFRKRNYGRFTLASADSTSIDPSEYISVSQFYADMQSNYGKSYFPDVANEGEEAQILADVMQAAEPLEVNPFEQYMGEAVESLANRIAMDAVDGALRPVAPTDADRAKSRREALNEQIKELKRQQKLSDKDARELWTTIYDLTVQLDRAGSKYKTLQVNSENRLAQVRAEGRERQAEIKAAERAKAAEKITALKKHYREMQENARERRQENAGVTKYRQQVFKKAGKLREMLLKNDDKMHVPEVLKKPLGDFLASLDFTSKRALAGGDETQKDRAFAANLQRLEQLLRNQQDYINGGEMKDDLGGYIDVSPDNLEFLRNISEMITQALSEGRAYTINQMSAAELKDLSQFLSNLSHAIRGMNAFMANARFESVREAASKDIESIRQLGKVSDTENGKIFHAATWENGTPYYVFRRFGEGGRAIFDAFTRGWEKMAFNAKQIMDFTEKTYNDKEVRDWQKEMHEITLEDGSEVRMTTAQIMELSMLLGREQAVKHISKGGIRIADISMGGDKVRTDTKHYHLTDGDIKAITGLLTDRQAEVAKALQQYMAKQGADWGNEVSMRRFGYRFYTEGDAYYPIKTDSNDRPMSDTDAQQNSMFRLLNLSASKSLNPKASNALIVGDIFDTFADHMSDMAKLNGMGLPILDAIKWFNFKERIDLEDGGYDTRTMQGAMEEAFGKQALSYFRTLMKDINGMTESGDRGTGLLSKLMGNYKAAAVAANLRVAFLQPTSYVRASYLVKPRYLLQAFTDKNAYREAMEYSGTAVWKSLGYYDTNIARGMRDQIKHNEGWKDKVVDASMKAAEFGDSRTWGRLWVACKIQTAAETGLEGEELKRATADLFREVIYSSQVMDSTLTRSELMRGRTLYSKAMTAFMAEPTLSYNMVMDAAMELNMNAKRYGKAQAWQKSKGYVAKALSVYLASASFSAIVESVFDALRDDDDYENFLLKWSQAMFGEGNIFAGNLAQDLTIIGKLPYLKNFVSTLQGYNSGDMSLAAFSNAINAYKIWKETIDLATGKLDEPTNVTYHGKMTAWGKIYKSLQAISQFSGFAVANMTRDVLAVWNTAMDWTSHPQWKIRTYDPGPKKAIQNAFTSGNMSEEEAIQKLMETGAEEDENKAYWTVRGWDGEDKYSELEAAALSGDEAAVKAEFDQLASHGVAEKDATSALRSFLKKAYSGEELSKEEARALGDRKLTEKEAQQLLVKYGGKDADDAYFAVKSWETGDEGKYTALYRAAFTGDQTAFKAEMKDLTGHGVKEKDAKGKIRDFVKSLYFGNELSEEMQEIVGDRKLSDADARKMLYHYAGYSVDDANKTVADWKEEKAFVAKHGAEYEQYDLSVSQAKYYYSDVKGKATLSQYSDQVEQYGLDDVKAYYGKWAQTGLTLPQYETYKTEAAACKGVDQNHDGKSDAYSIKNQKLAVINRLPVSSAVKDAIYRANNWKESDLYKAPWHR